MSREPSFPPEAAVGTGEAAADSGEAAKKPADPNRTRNIVTGAAIGIGSAAIVAALLYSSRPKRDDKGS